MEDECADDRARCWVVLCLARMLLKNAPSKRPWMGLSSQYWCSLLEHADMLLHLLEEPQKVGTSSCRSPSFRSLVNRSWSDLQG